MSKRGTGQVNPEDMSGDSSADFANPQMMPESGAAMEAAAGTELAIIDTSAEPAATPRGRGTKRDLAQAAHSARDEVVKRLAAKRKGIDYEEPEIDGDTATDVVAADAAARRLLDRAPEPQDSGNFEDAPAQAPARAPASAAQPDEVFRLRVDHQDVELTRQQVIALAQQGLAAPNRYQEAAEASRRARELLADAERMHNNARQLGVLPAHQQELANPDDGRSAPTIEQDTEDRARLAAIGDQLIYGEDEDRIAALEALKEVYGQQGQQQGQPVNPSEIAAMAVHQLRSEMAAAEARALFEEKHAPIAQSPIFARDQANLMYHVVLRELTSLHESGNYEVQEYLNQVMPDAEMSQQRAYEIHTELRNNGWGLSTSTQIADYAAERLKAHIVETAMALLPPQPEQPQASLPAPTPAQGRREQAMAAKQGLTQQPRRAGVAGRPQVAPKTRSSVVDAMKAARGFATLS